MYVAILISAAVILSAAYIGDIRGAIQGAFPGQYRLLVGGIVIAAIAITVAAASVTIRERRALRYALLAGAILGAAGYIATFRTGNPDVDVVEAFHFVEYGAVGALFYRAWRPYGGARAVALPLTAGLVVGTLDEAFQWYLASRVGEAHDVGIDLAATACGVLFGLALHPLPAGLARTTPAARRLVMASAAGALGLFVAFGIMAHAGYEIRDADAGTFRSRYSAAGLARISADRAQTWRNGMVESLARFAAEDHYLSEARWHVRARNDTWAAKNVFAAWRENLILEKYFSPALDALNARWPVEQRAEAEQLAGIAATSYVSEASPIPIYAW
jgi:hypothetical protein